MMTLITGGSKCGKSHFAEALLESFAGTKIYLAAMQPYGEEAQAAIARHRAMRSGKGFETVERYTDIGGLFLPPQSAVLLECMGNLLANEMFRGTEICDCTEKIIRETKALSAQCSQFVIVTNQVGSDGIVYAEGTAAYIAALGKINSALAAQADSVIECVYGIPITRKGRVSC